MTIKGRTIFVVRVEDIDGNPPKDREMFSKAIFSMADELGELKEVADPLVEADLSKGLIEFSLSVIDAADEFDSH